MTVIAPVEGLHGVHADLVFLQKLTFRSPINVLGVQRIVGTVWVAISDHYKRPGGKSNQKRLDMSI